MTLLRLKLAALGLLSLSLPFQTAHADVYEYSGTQITCHVSAEKQVIGGAPTSIGRGLSQSFGFQMFKSQNYSARFTSMDYGSRKAVQDMLAAGGIPNQLAAMNYLVANDMKYILTEFRITNSVAMPVRFTLEDYGQVTVKAAMDLKLSLKDANDILSALGEVGAPDFTVDTPVVSWTGYTPGFQPTLIETQSHHQHWSTMPSGPWYISSYSTPVQELVQIHYPLLRHNGLSYHIRFICDGNESY